MKRKLIFIAAFFSIAIAFSSCESLGTCKICRQVTYVDGAVTQEGPETEYCDAELIAVETAKDVISGNTRKTWECR